MTIFTPGKFARTLSKAQSSSKPFFDKKTRFHRKTRNGDFVDLNQRAVRNANDSILKTSKVTQSMLSWFWKLNSLCYLSSSRVTRAVVCREFSANLLAVRYQAPEFTFIMSDISLQKSPLINRVTDSSKEMFSDMLRSNKRLCM